MRLHVPNTVENELIYRQLTYFLEKALTRAAVDIFVPNLKDCCIILIEAHLLGLTQKENERHK